MGCSKSKPLRSQDTLIVANATTLGRMDHVLSVLQSLTFFSHLSREQLEKAAMCFQTHEVAQGETIFENGSDATTFYVIAQGTVRVVVPDETGIERAICTKRSGEFFGEVALLHNCRRTAKLVVHSGGGGGSSGSSGGGLTNSGSRVTDLDVAEVEGANANGEHCSLLTLSREDYKRTHSQPWNKALTVFLKSSAASVMSDSLRKIPFLQALSEIQLTELGGLFQFREFKEEEQIFQQGQDGDGFYVVANGTVLVHAEVEGGEQVQLSSLGPGAYFGEMALVHDAPRAASATAVQNVTLFCLKKRDFLQFIKIAPSAKMSLEQMASQRTADSLKKQNIPFFKGLHSRKLAMLAETCTMQQFEPGHTVFKQGEEAQSFFIVTHGTLEVLVDGQHRTLLERGQYFGEVALVADVPRTATVRATASGASCLELKRDDFLAIFAREPQALAEMEIRVLQREATLKNVLRHPIGRAYFTQQLEQEFSLENIEFWHRAEDFYTLHKFGNRLRSRSVAVRERDTVRNELARQASEIFEQFVSEDAPSEINVRSATKKRLIKEVRAGKFSASMFRAAQNEIYALMEADNYARFKSSDLFERFLREIGAYSDGSLHVAPDQMRISRTCTVVSPPGFTPPTPGSTKTYMRDSASSVYSGSAYTSDSGRASIGSGTDAPLPPPVSVNVSPLDAPVGPAQQPSPAAMGITTRGRQHSSV